jgi:AbrB family looped-hinge helix DNA binding protein
LQRIRYAESMSIRNSAQAAVSRIGQRRQVVIPKAVFEALQLQEGDFLEMTVQRGRLAMQPKRLVDVGDVLTKSEAAKVRRGEAQLKAGRSRPWRTAKHEVGR